MLNYGQGVFEGMKAFRTVEDELLVLEPDENAARCEERFADAFHAAVRGIYS